MYYMRCDNAIMCSDSAVDHFFAVLKKVRDLEEGLDCETLAQLDSVELGVVLVSALNKIARVGFREREGWRELFALRLPQGDHHILEQAVQARVYRSER